MRRNLIILAVALATATVAFVLGFAGGPSPRLAFGNTGVDQWTPAQFSPDGKYILVRGYRDNSRRGPPYDGELQLWDVLTGKILTTFLLTDEKPTQIIHRVGFSYDGNLVMACGQDLPLVVWDLASKKQIHVLGGTNPSFPKPTIWAVECFSTFPKSTKILTSQSDIIRLWDMKTGKIEKETDINKYHRISDPVAILLSKNGKYVIFDSGTQISIWDFKTMDLRFRGTNHASEFPNKDFLLPKNTAILGRALSPSGQSLLITTRFGEIFEFEIESGKQSKKYRLNTDGDIHVLAVSPKGDKIMTTGFHGNTIVYSFPECKEIKRMPGYGHVQFSPDGKTALTFTKNGRMMLWDLDK